MEGNAETEDICSHCPLDHDTTEDGICEYERAFLMGRRAIVLFNICPIRNTVVKEEP